MFGAAGIQGQYAGLQCFKRKNIGFLGLHHFTPRFRLARIDIWTEKFQGLRSSQQIFGLQGSRDRQFPLSMFFTCITNSFDASFKSVRSKNGLTCDDFAGVCLGTYSEKLTLFPLERPKNYLSELDKAKLPSALSILEEECVFQMFLFWNIWNTS